MRGCGHGPLGVYLSRRNRAFISRALREGGTSELWIQHYFVFGDTIQAWYSSGHWALCSIKLRHFPQLIFPFCVFWEPSVGRFTPGERYKRCRVAEFVFVVPCCC